MQTAADIPLRVTSDNASSERRITPSWTIGQLKTRLEPVTGIPPLCQRLNLRSRSGQVIQIDAIDEENTRLDFFPLASSVELNVIDTRPPGLRPNYTDASQVKKYELPLAEYEKRDDSVLAWKKTNKFGRFDPNALSVEETRLREHEIEIQDRDIQVERRCRIGGEDTKRGVIKYVGIVDQIPGGGKWVGVQLDEPVGQNDGSIGGKRYWRKTSDANHGVFVRPERVETGEWPVLNDLEDMEEI